jgi:hypothetical protein
VPSIGSIPIKFTRSSHATGWRYEQERTSSRDEQRPPIPPGLVQQPVRPRLVC